LAAPGRQRTGPARARCRSTSGWNLKLANLRVVATNSVDVSTLTEIPPLKSDITRAAPDVADEKLFDFWFDPIEAELRTKVRGFIEAMIEDELDITCAAALRASVWATGEG